MQIAQRGIPGAEIIDAQPHTQLAQCPQRPEHAIGVLQHGGLGDLDDQRSRIETRVVQGGPHHIVKVAGGKLTDEIEWLRAQGFRLRVFTS